MQFNKVIGQQKLKQHLIRETQSEKISHAQLFLGKPGYGTLALALAFSQYILCADRTDDDSCGKCPACVKVTNLQHPDLHFSYPSVLANSKTASGIFSFWREQVLNTPYFDLNHWIDIIDEKGRRPVIGTDESMEIIKRLNLKSFEGGMKIMIIWEANEMNTTAANKLLKILEEPPLNTLFILISESSDLMLQTILSRTQMLKVPRIETEELVAHLKNTAQLSASNAESINARAEGDVIQALELISDHESKEKDLFIELMRVCYKKDVLEMIAWSEKMALTSREQQKSFLKYALHMFRQSMLKNYTDDMLLRVSADEAAFLKNFAKFISGNNILDFMKTFNDGHYHLERNANARILFTNICFQVMRYIHVA